MTYLSRRAFRAGSILRAATLATMAATGLVSYSIYRPAEAQPAAAVLPAPVTIPLDKATRLAVPPVKTPLTPQPVKSKTLLKGWLVKIPGDHPIATPAYSDGKLYVGGGYGSYEFYCFSADTGRVIWKYHTGDDGPTAAVVEDGCVAFNTESCTVYVLDAKTGKEMWKQWLGDPLMSQPAIGGGKLFMAYPSAKHADASASHELLCADLRTGKHFWTKPIACDVISAPVIAGDRVYAACLDGSSYCFDMKTGRQVWKKTGSGTSAPLVHNGNVIMAERAGGAGGRVEEGLRRFDARQGAQIDAKLIAASPAPYIKGATNGTIGPQGAPIYGNQSTTAWYKTMDSSVGFGNAPASANMGRATSNLGITSVSGAWGYQGARAAYHDGLVTNAQLNFVNSVDAKTGAVKWRAEAKAPFLNGQAQVFSPPALGKNNLYLCSGNGQLVCMGQKDGKVKYMYDTQQPISFQPALVGGKVYIGTSNGMLMCLDTGDSDADGWTAWGGNAQHNKTN